MKEGRGGLCLIVTWGTDLILGNVGNPDNLSRLIFGVIIRRKKG